MAYTVQQTIDRARVPLNDAAKTIPDSTLLLYCHDALNMILRLRPDLFFGQYAALPVMSSLVVGSNLPIADEYMAAVADYITARAETPNDVDAVMARATMFFALFKEGVSS